MQQNAKEFPAVALSIIILIIYSFIRKLGWSAKGKFARIYIHKQVHILYKLESLVFEFQVLQMKLPNFEMQFF